MRRLTLALVVGLVGSVLAGGLAYATHLFPAELRPASAALSFLVSTSRIEDIPVEAVARAANPDGSRMFVQHAIFAPGQSTGWHTHPGPVFVMIIAGSLTLEDPQGSNCPARTVVAGAGFVDRGVCNIHRATAGPARAEFYAPCVFPSDGYAGCES